MNLDNIKHILISRTDNIGDVILTLPMASILKKNFPQVKISFLARNYVRDVVALCSHVDEFVNWDELSQLKEFDAIAEIKKRHIDVVIHAFPKKLIARLMKKAGVPYRIGTSNRLFHWFSCNERVKFSRAKSDLHEAQLNLKLLTPFNLSIDDDLNVLGNEIGLCGVKPLPPHLQSILKPDRFNLIIHPFTNGNAREWPVSHFNALIRQLPSDRVHIIVTGSQKENEMIQSRIMSQCPQITNLAGQCTLQEFIQFIGNADGLIANSTGPMHIAAALGIRTLGLFPVTHGMHTGRWAPLGKKVTLLTADPNCNSLQCRGKNDCFCMESITVDQVKNEVMGWIS